MDILQIYKNRGEDSQTFRLEDELAAQDVQSLLCVIDLMRNDIQTLTYRYMDDRSAGLGLGVEGEELPADMPHLKSSGISLLQDLLPCLGHIVFHVTLI